MRSPGSLRGPQSRLCTFVPTVVPKLGCVTVCLSYRACGIPEKYCAQLERRALAQAGATPNQAQPQEDQSSSSITT